MSDKDFLEAMLAEHATLETRGERVLIAEVRRLREELARVSTRRMQLAAELAYAEGHITEEVASTAYVRAKPWTGSYPGELEPLRNPDHADTTQDTTKTRCARNEQETSTSAEDLAGVSRTVAANWDENS